jgi:hypothetical protein
VLLERGAAGPGPTVKPSGDNHIVAGIDELRRLDAKLGEFGELGQDSSDALVSAIHRRVGIVISVPPFDIGIR